MIDIHGALNGVAAQVQGTDIAFFRNADFGQMGFGWAQAAVRMAGWHGQRRKDVEGAFRLEARKTEFLETVVDEAAAAVVFMRLPPMPI